MQRLASRQAAIVTAAAALAADAGMSAVQIAPVAERAGIAAGTVYRYFPSKVDLVAALVAAVSEREISAMRRAAEAAPGPLSALAAAITTFAARALRDRRLTWAVIAEPVDREVDVVRAAYRRALTEEIEARIRAALVRGHLPEQDTAVSAAAVIGALLEGLIGPWVPQPAQSAEQARAAVQALTLLCLRALGVIDPRARGLVVQAAIPAEDAA